MALGAVALVVIESLLLLGIGERTAWKLYLLGMLHAVIIAAFLGAVTSTFIAHDREAIFQLRGAWGEENTRDQLRKAQHKKLIWGWVDSVAVAFGDIDHLVVTRSGGLLAIDSKWRSHSDGAGRDAMVQSAQRCKVRAEGVIRSLRKPEQTRRGGAASPRPLRPVVVVWGALQDDIAQGTMLDGVEFVGGRQLVSWLRGLDGNKVEQDEAKDLIERLEAFRATAWPTATRR